MAHPEPLGRRLQRHQHHLDSNSGLTGYLIAVDVGPHAGRPAMCGSSVSLIFCTRAEDAFASAPASTTSGGPPRLRRREAGSTCSAASTNQRSQASAIMHAPADRLLYCTAGRPSSRGAHAPGRLMSPAGLSGHTAAIASGSPVSPSLTTMGTSCTPRFFNSVSTCSQCLAPSPPAPAHNPRLSRCPLQACFPAGLIVRSEQAQPVADELVAARVPRDPTGGLGDHTSRASPPPCDGSLARSPGGRCQADPASACEA